MIKTISFTIFLSIISQIGFTQTQIGGSISGDGSNNRLGISVALSSDGLTFAAGAPITAGYVKIYTLNGANWVQKGNTVLGNGSAEYFGKSISLSSNGNILSVGAYTHNSNTGCVRVYSFNGNNWVQLGTTIYGENTNDYFGCDVSLSSDGTKLAVGAYGNDTNGTDSGHIKIFKFINNNWFPMGSTIIGDLEGDRLGRSLSLSSNGNILAAASPTNDGNNIDSGQVKIYNYNGSDWIQLGNSLYGENSNNQFGSDVSLSSDGTKLAVGASFNNGNGLQSGHTRVFSFNGSNWTQIGSDINGEAAGDLSGNSISLSSNGNILAIAAYQNDGNGTNSGHVRIYNLVGNNWLKIGNDINGSASNDWFGSDVSLSSNGSVVCIGSPKNSSNGITESGQVKVYNLSTILSSDEFISNNSNIYPNPANENVYIELKENLNLLKVNVYNTLGQLIKVENNQIINISSLDKGIYYFEVITDKGKATKQIIIK